MTQVAEKGKWATLVKLLETDVVENDKKPSDQKKKIGELLEDFSKKHDTTLSTTKYKYYTEVKPKLSELPKEEKAKSNLDANIEEFSRLNSQELANVKNHYKVGDIPEVEITSILDFGAFVRTRDGYEGLIHISEITKEFVTLPEDYFYVGERVNAKVIRFDKDKLSLSTKAVGGKEKLNPAFKELAIKKAEEQKRAKRIEKAKETSNVSSVEKKEEPPKPSNIRKETTPTPAPVPAPALKESKATKVGKVNKNALSKVSIMDNDKDNIIGFIKRYSDNNVSKQALLDIESMVEEFGVFQTTISLMETVRDLDISSFITSKTKERLEGERLRRSRT